MKIEFQEEPALAFLGWVALIAGLAGVVLVLAILNW